MKSGGEWRNHENVCKSEGWNVEESGKKHWNARTFKRWNVSIKLVAKSRIRESKLLGRRTLEDEKEG